MSALTADQITAGYKGVPVVRGVSLEVEAGKTVAIVGPNGAGKSTCLKAIVGLLKGTTGTVRVNGTDVSGWATPVVTRQGLGYVPQVSNVFPSLSVQENLELGCYVAPKLYAQQLPKVLELFPDLKSALRRKGGELSGGQRMMLALGRALMADPKVLMLDEPTAGLSPLYAQKVWSLIGDVAGSGVGVLVVEQNVGMALAGSDWVYVLTGGRNNIDGPARDMDPARLGEIFLGAGGGDVAEARRE